MLPFIKNSIIEIDQLYPQTNACKQKRLLHLKNMLIEMAVSPDLSVKNLADLAGFCRDCLADTQFTFKQFRLFGLLLSRSEKIILRLLKKIEMNSVLLFLDKIKIDSINDLIMKEDYREALKQVELRVVPEHALQYVREWLTHKADLQISLPDMKTYSALMWPVLEYNPAQKVYDLDGVKKIVQSQSDNRPISFTYAIDINKNIKFSSDAENSHHINLCGGRPVYGAGEVYVAKNGDQSVLICVNNRSGLYKPATEALESIKKWFYLNEFSIEYARTENESEKMLVDALEQRMLLR